MSDPVRGMRRGGAVALALIALVAACSGDDDVTTASPESAASTVPVTSALTMAPYSEAGLEAVVRDMWARVTSGDAVSTYELVAETCGEEWTAARWIDEWALLPDLEAELAAADLSIRDVPLVIDVHWHENEGPTDRHRAVQIGIAYDAGAVVDPDEPGQALVWFFGGDQVLWEHDGTTWHFADCWPESVLTYSAAPARASGTTAPSGAPRRSPRWARA